MMSKPLSTPIAGAIRDCRSLGEERDAWKENRQIFLEGHGQDMAIAVALRPVRRANTYWQLLCAIEEVLVRDVGVDAYAIIDPPDAPTCVRGHRAMDDDELRAFLEAAPGGGPRVLALYPLGAGSATLGSVAICRLMPGKERLDAYDYALLSALAAQTALALRRCEELERMPTSRPPKPE